MRDSDNSSRESGKLHKAIAKSALIVAALFVVSVTAWSAEWQFDNVSRVVAIADIHGAYDAAVEAMKAADVIDGDLAWHAGDSHLVIVGDILDRGPDSRAAMDLLMRLEEEAAAAGGEVHVLIGNHEAMNLLGDMRYVSAREYAAFAGDETDEERQRWFTAFAQQRASSDESPEALATIFKQKFPKGYFAHRRAFGSKGKYGAWLLSKPAIVVINGTAFVHGGLSPMVARIGLEGVNRQLVGEMADYVEQLQVLYDAGVLLPTDAFYDHPGLLARHLPAIDATSDVLSAVDVIKKLNESELQSLEGPLWYRGNIVCSELIEADKLAAALDAIGANRVVIGHTPTAGRVVLERLDGKVVQIDTGMLNNYYGGSANVLVIEDGMLKVINQDGETVATPVPNPRNVGTRPEGQLTYAQIEAILANGEVISRREDDVGRDIVTVTDGTSTLEGVFYERRNKGVYPEVAAYRLDKMIDLDMVPVAVVRTIDGDDGALQFLPKNWIDEVKRQEEGRGGSAWCAVPEQWNAMFVWDRLTYNEGRSGRNLLYSLDWWQVMLVDHERAFSTRKGMPASLRQATYTVGQAWKDAAAGLTEEVLTEELGDVLDARRIRALAARAQELASL